MDEPGAMTLIEGDEETKRWLRGESRRVDDWLYELVDQLTFYAAERVKVHAPGGIKELVDVDLTDRTASGAFEGTAGVEPDISEENFGRGLGSDPADYPVFVEVGTGVFGPVGKPISSIPGHLMGPIFNPQTGREHYVQTVQGQRPRRYAGESFDELVMRTPAVIKAELLELGRRT